jgi:hypothetical protein
MNRIPRGPYAAEEISRFLDQGLLRATDLAYLSHDDPKAPHEWRFLWQFEEFERRKKGSDGLQPGQVPRQTLSTEQIKGKILSQLPSELIDVSREEIDRRIEPEPIADIPPVQRSKSGLEPEREETLVDSRFEWPSRRSFYLPLVALTIALAVFLFWRSSHGKHGVRELATPSNAGTDEAQQPGSPPAAGQAQPQSPPRPRAGVNLARPGMSSSPLPPPLPPAVNVPAANVPAVELTDAPVEEVRETASGASVESPEPVEPENPTPAEVPPENNE